MKFPLTFVPRADPLAPDLALAAGEARAALKARLLTSDATFVGGAAGSLLFITGAALPWLDGIAYFGRDPRAPAIYWPTTLTPAQPFDAAATAILARTNGEPCIVVPERALIVRLPVLQPLTRAFLEALA